MLHASIYFHFSRIDETLREYALDSAGLHEIARIPFEGRPGNLQSDEERAVLVVEDSSGDVTKGLYLCRQEGTRWSRTQNPLTLDDQIVILCWTRVEETHIAIVDRNSDGSVLILEYV